MVADSRAAPCRPRTASPPIGRLPASTTGWGLSRFPFPTVGSPVPRAFMIGGLTSKDQAMVLRALAALLGTKAASEWVSRWARRAGADPRPAGRPRPRAPRTPGDGPARPTPARRGDPCRLPRRNSTTSGEPRRPPRRGSAAAAVSAPNPAPGDHAVRAEPLVDAAPPILPSMIPFAADPRQITRRSARRRPRAGRASMSRPRRASSRPGPRPDRAGQLPVPPRLSRPPGTPTSAPWYDCVTCPL